MAETLWGTCWLCNRAAGPVKKGENYPLLLVGRLGAGDSGTLGPRPMNCQSAYASCEGEFGSPGEMSGPMNGEVIQKIDSSKGLGQ